MTFLYNTWLDLPWYMALPLYHMTVLVYHITTISHGHPLYHMTVLLYHMILLYITWPYITWPSYILHTWWRSSGRFSGVCSGFLHNSTSSHITSYCTSSGLDWGTWCVWRGGGERVGVWGKEGGPEGGTEGGRTEREKGRLNIGSPCNLICCSLISLVNCQFPKHVMSSTVVIDVLVTGPCTVEWKQPHCL